MKIALADSNLKLNEIVGGTYFFVYRVNGIFGSNEQLIFFSIEKSELKELLELTKEK